MGDNYYGLLNDGKYGWNTNTQEFKPGGITDGVVGSKFYDGTGGIGSNVANSATGSSIYGTGMVAEGGKPSLLQNVTGYNQVGKNGATVSNPGVGSLGLGVFNAWNSWNQGNKMYDLQEDALAFSKDQYWNNFMMQRGLMNDQLNTKNRNRAISSARGATPGMTTAEDAALVNNMETQFNRTDALVRADGSTYNMAGNAAPAEFNQASPTVESAEAWTAPYGSTRAPAPTGDTSGGSGAERPADPSGGSATDPKPEEKTKAKTATAKDSKFNKKKLGR